MKKQTLHQQPFSGTLFLAYDHRIDFREGISPVEMEFKVISR